MKKVLIVDDEKDVLAILEKRLTDGGYEVLTADNGEDAIIMARNRHPDLVILDVMMPGMDGSQVASELSEDAVTKGIPIIFLTCLMDKEEEGEKIRGGKYFMAKPYNSDEILDVVEKHIGK